MEISAYYEGSEQTERWLNCVLDRSNIVYKKIPTQNISSDFTRLPAYVSDILYLDKPDIILSGSIDGKHEKPIFSIEFASCTPQYQHALQRFSRMMASVVNGCPSLLIIPSKKRENDEGKRVYQRSRAVEYGAIKLMDIYGTPAFIFDWDDDDGILKMEDFSNLPKLDTPSMLLVKRLLKSAIKEFYNIDYVSALWRIPLVKELLDQARVRAYAGGAPSIQQPGGGNEGGVSHAKLDLLNTDELLALVSTRSRTHAAQILKIPDFITERNQSLVFYPTRVTSHAGDPYVGMIGYYDIAFCRVGTSTRDRSYNLVADCREVSINEIDETMKAFHENNCPFSNSVTTKKIESYSYHIKNGCKATKSKPIRIYGELADLIIFKDGLIFNVG
jgi:hypothetical protein